MSDTVKFDAVLLAAGYGKRLRPLTNYLPKCLVPINGCPLIDYWIYLLVQGGVENILINLHYKSEMVRQYLDMSPWREKITVVYEKELLGTAGTLVKNIGFYESELCFVAHADNYTDFDLKEFIKHHLKTNTKSPITMMTFETDTPQGCGIVEKNSDGIIIGFYEKIMNPPSNCANAAVYLFNKSTIKNLGSLVGIGGDISHDVIPQYLSSISTWSNNLYHRDIGTINSYNIAQSYSHSLVDHESKNRWRDFLSLQNISYGLDIDNILKHI